jgi:hypothetical protein
MKAPALSDDAADPAVGGRFFASPSAAPGNLPG